jgi:hypothetical protein
VSLNPPANTWSLTWDAACHAEIAYALDDPSLAALGNRRAATAAADRALEQARAWDMSASVRWLVGHRTGGSW